MTPMRHDSAYPTPVEEEYFQGISVRDYFAARAPKPQGWFAPEMVQVEPNGEDFEDAAVYEVEMKKWYAERNKQLYIQWPYAWADAVLEADQVRLTKLNAQKCRVCGCTHFTPCMTAAGPCHWAEPDLCSACVGKEVKS